MLLTLPLELIFLIRDHAPRPSQVHLALASKFLFVSLCPGRIFSGLDLNDLDAVLSGLERDSPNLYHCFLCSKLRLYDPDRISGRQRHLSHSCSYDLRTVHGQPVAPNDMDPRRAAFADFEDFADLTVTSFANFGNRNSLPSINDLPSCLAWSPGRSSTNHVSTFTEAHLIVNRHLYGTGLPLKVLESRFSFDRWLDTANLANADPHFPLENHVKNNVRPTRAVRRHAIQRSSKVEYIDVSYQVTVTRSVRKKMLEGSGFLDEGSLVNKRTTVRRSRPLPRLTTPWSFMHSTEAKVIDNELYISRHHHITGPLVTRIMFGKLIDKIDLPVCLHVRCREDKEPVSESYVCAPEFRGSCGGLADVVNSVGSCPFCFTDYEVSILRRQDEQRCELNLKTFHRLGICSTPASPGWGQAVGWTDRPRRSAEQGRYGAGEVLKRWRGEKARVADGDPEPRWVVPSRNQQYRMRAPWSWTWNAR